MRARFAASALLLGALAGIAFGCSLLAPSDDEAKAGLRLDGSLDPGSEAGTAEGGSGSGEGGSADARAPDDACGSGCFACNNRTCVGCAPNGAACDKSEECCSATCTRASDAGDAGTFCGVPQSQCTPNALACTSLAQCCSRLTCLSAGKTCGQCRLLSEACDGGSDCCSFVCKTGACAPCLKLGESCGSDSQCCNGHCHANGRCQ